MGLIASGFSYAPADLEALNIEVVWFSEVGPAFYRCKKLYPRARAFYGFEHMVTLLISDPASVPPCDITYGTFPCQDVTELKFENGYGTTKTAHLFTDTQKEFFSIYKSPVAGNEMVMPTRRNGHEVYCGSSAIS